ncbi:MAG: hypothetical protein ACFCVA_11085 [Gammaproteobacteria bacterium]
MRNIVPQHRIQVIEPHLGRQGFPAGTALVKAPTTAERLGKNRREQPERRGRPARSDETYQVDKRGTSTAQRRYRAGCVADFSSISDLIQLSEKTSRCASAVWM